MAENENEERRVRPFAGWLTETNRGRTHADLSDGLHQLVETVLQLGKPGELILRVKVGVLDGDSRQVSVAESVQVKLPQPEARKSIFFADDDGNLSRTDPAQLSFGDIKVVPNTDEGKEQAK